jgi:tetratricopeptide (TPR) repeat protein
MNQRRLSFINALFIFFLISCTSHDKDVKPFSDPNSIVSIKNAIKEYPDSLMLKENLIEAYRNEGYYDSAINITSRELVKDSGNAYLWNIKATLYFENGDTSNSIKSLEQAIDIYPLPEYLVALGTVYAEVKNKKALLIAEKILKSEKSKYDKDAYFIKGLYYNYMNEPIIAISNLDSCIRLDYTYMYAYREKAIALYNQSKYEAALNVLERAVTVQNNFDEGYFWMGKCYEKLNRKDAAMQSYQNALLYDKDYSEARNALERLQNKK